MSLDFTVTFACPERPVGSTLIEIARRLGPLGYVRSTNVVAADMDPQRGVFDEVDEELGERHLSDSSASLDEWPGAAVEFLSRDTGSIYVLLGRSRSFYLNVWVDVPEAWLRRMVHEAREQSFYSVVSAVADASNASVALGDLEQAFEPRSPEELQAYIRQCADVSVRSNTQLFVLPAQDEPYVAVKRTWGEKSKMWRKSGYWIVETEDYREFWSR